MKTNLKTIRELLNRAQKRVTCEYARTSEGKRLLKMAKEYNIPYDSKDIDWLQLHDDVYEYIGLVKKAEAYNLGWDHSVHDPLGLEQAIEDYEMESHAHDMRYYHQSYREKFA